MKRTFTLLFSGLFATMQVAYSQWTLLTNTGYQAVKSVTSGGGALYMVATTTSSGVATVYKSPDGGSSWNPSGSGLPGGQSVQSVHMANGVLLCGTENGVYRSTDAGGSWTLANTGLPTASVSNHVKKFFQFGTTTIAVYSATIGGGGGIYRSTDGGLQWFSGNNGLATNMIVNQVAQVGTLLYAATSTGLASSSNQAVTWTQIPTANFACHAVQGSPARLVVISGLGYRYSNNGGSTWTNAIGAPSAPMGGELILYDGKYWAINTNSPMDVLRSTDNGASFSVYENGLQGADAIAQNTFHASGNVLYLGCFTNLYAHSGTTLGLGEETPAALPAPYPSLFAEGFFVPCGPEHAGSTVLLIDARGREAGRQGPLAPGANWVVRGALTPGAYRVVLMDRSTGALRPLGTVVAE
jgi:hypothetical protein